MGICSYYCDSIINTLKALSPRMEVVLAHERVVKDVPVNKIIAAVGIKKCVISDLPDDKIDNSVKIETETRTALITIGINIYAPYSEGTKGSVGVFDDIFNTFLRVDSADLNEAKLLGTKYSREAQCLVTETEFVFESYMSGWIEGPPPIVIG